MTEPFPCTPPPRRPTLAGLERCWARGLMSNEELLGCMLHYLVREEQNQEPRTKNQEPDEQNQEPRTKNRSDDVDEAGEVLEVSELVAENSTLKTQNSTLRAQLLGLSRLLWQVGEAVDVLGGEELDIWQEDGRWYWHWEDTGSVAPRPLRSHGDALVDAVEHRAGLLAPE